MRGLVVAAVSFNLVDLQHHLATKNQRTTSFSIRSSVTFLQQGCRNILINEHLNRNLVMASVLCEDRRSLKTVASCPAT
jgi:hypothetical protein